MIEARIRIADDETDWFPGLCELAALPPIGAHVRVMDRNSNARLLRVTDIHLEAVSLTFKEQFPSLSDGQRMVMIIGEEVFGKQV
ncbi:MAG TPA: hypothetical protein VL094_07810 [Sphingomonadaceae bacterium]|nr:hypothetical protein [Sphingomonadaceae bacterium]